MSFFKSPHLSTRIIIVGDLMLDRYWHGDTAHISPEAPVPVVVDPKHSDFSTYRGATEVTPNMQEFLAPVSPCPALRP